MRIPSDISEDFQESWEAFTELPQTKSLKPDVLADCFRIFLNQAGINIQPYGTAKKYLTVNKRYDVFGRIITQKYMLYQLLPLRHTFELDLNEQRLVNVINGFTIRGRVKLKPQRFALKYLLERMVTLRVWPTMPECLTSNEDNGASGKKITRKPPSSMQSLKDRDFALVYRDATTEIKVARLKGGFLVLDYALDFPEVFPMYPNVEKQLTALWRRATIGDFR